MTRSGSAIKTSISSFIRLVIETISGGRTAITPGLLLNLSGSISGSIVLCRGFGVGFLLEVLHFGMHGIGDADRAVFGENLAVFLHKETAHHFLAVAAAEKRIDADRIE